jgi:hypothetical protein
VLLKDAVNLVRSFVGSSGVLLVDDGAESYPFLFHVDFRVGRHDGQRPSRSVSSTAVGTSPTSRSPRYDGALRRVVTPVQGPTPCVAVRQNVYVYRMVVAWSQHETLYPFMVRTQTRYLNVTDIIPTPKTKPQEVKNGQGGGIVPFITFRSTCIFQNFRRPHAPEGRPAHASHIGYWKQPLAVTHRSIVAKSKLITPGVEVPGRPPPPFPARLCGSECAFVLWWRYPRVREL